MSDPRKRWDNSPLVESAFIFLLSLQQVDPNDEEGSRRLRELMFDVFNALILAGLELGVDGTEFPFNRRNGWG